MQAELFASPYKSDPSSHSLRNTVLPVNGIVQAGPGPWRCTPHPPAGLDFGHLSSPHTRTPQCRDPGFLQHPSVLFISRVVRTCLPSTAGSSSCPLAPLRIALKSWSEVAMRRSYAQTWVSIQLLSPVNAPHQVGRDVALTTGPFPNAPRNRMGAVLSSTYHVPMASYLPGCHMFRIILLPDACQSFPFQNVIFPRIYWHPTMLLLGWRSGFSAIRAQNRNHTQPWQ